MKKVAVFCLVVLLGVTCVFGSLALADKTISTANRDQDMKALVKMLTEVKGKVRTYFWYDRGSGWEAGMLEPLDQNGPMELERAISIAGDIYGSYLNSAEKWSFGFNGLASARTWDEEGNYYRIDFVDAPLNTNKLIGANGEILPLNLDDPYAKGYGVLMVGGNGQILSEQGWAEGNVELVYTLIE